VPFGAIVLQAATIWATDGPIGVAAYKSGTAFAVPLSKVVRQQYTFAVPLFRQQDSICVIADFANLIFLKHQMLDSVIEMSVIYSAHSQV